MAMAISMQCGIVCTEYRVRAGRRRKRQRIRARVILLAVAAAMLVLMSYGEHWLLQQAPATPSELAAATYAVDALSGGAVVVDADANDLHPNTNDLRPEDKDLAR